MLHQATFCWLLKIQGEDLIKSCQNPTKCKNINDEKRKMGGSLRNFELLEIIATVINLQFNSYNVFTLQLNFGPPPSSKSVCDVSTCFSGLVLENLTNLKACSSVPKIYQSMPPTSCQCGICFPDLSINISVQCAIHLIE